MKRSSFASESSRSETRTLTRSERREHGGQRLGEGARAAVVGVVEEVLLGLVEDEVDVAVGLRLLERGDGGAVDRRRRPPPRPPPRAPTFGSSLQLEKTTTSGSSGSARSERATAARRSDDFPTPLGPYSTVSRDAMRFATTISRLALAPEEEQRVELGVLEGVEALVRRLGLLAHAASSRRSSSSTYDCGSTSSARDVEPPPERLRERARRALHRPRAVRRRAARPRSG